MGSITQTDQQFWLAYCDAIATTAGFSAGPTNAIFFGTNAQRGPPAGNNINAAFTNTGLYAIADNLLQPDNLFYVPSASNSYCKSLLTYMGYVDLKGNPTSEQYADLTTKLQNMRIAQQAVVPARTAAFTDFQQQVTMGMLDPGMSFPKWINNNAPAYNATKSTYDSASAQYQAAINKVYGAQASQFSADSAKLSTAMLGNIAQPGLNMEACQETAASSLAIYQAISSNSPVPAPTGLYLVPYYSSPNYTSIANDFMGYINNTKVPTQSVGLNLGGATDKDTSKYGIVAQGGTGSFSWIPWISANVSASSTLTSSAIFSEATAQNTTAVMTYKKIMNADIAPGTWNIGDPKNTYQLRSDAPSSIRTLVRPSRLVLGCGIGWQITVADNTTESFDTALKEVQAANGTLNVLGLSCSVGGSSTQSTDNTTHSASCDSSGKVLTVTPTFDAGFATVLAIIGEKIQTV